MKKKIFAAVLAFLTLIMVLLAGSTQSFDKSHQINELYIFGDSLSDIGNVFKATNGVYPPSPPYFQGRYSNGPVWVEYLGSQLGLTNAKSSNFAYGGATTVSGSLNGVPGTLAQVYTYTKSHQKLNPNGLYVIWAGANDYLFGAEQPAASIGNLSSAIKSLSSAGAKKILVANLPDLGKLPATYNIFNSRALSSLTNLHNLELAKTINLFHQESGNSTKIFQLDVNSLYREAMDKPEKFGLTNVTQGCVSNLATCDNPNKFLFWDGIHPTTAAHRILAQAALKTLSE